MGILARLFGYEGTVRFEGTLTNGTPFTGKTHIEAINLTHEEMAEELKNVLYVETGKRAATIRIIAAT